MPSGRPAAFELDHLLARMLTPADGVLEDHLGKCPTCWEKLNALPVGEESWLKAKQTAPDDPVDSPPLRQAMNRLKRIGEIRPFALLALATLAPLAQAQINR